MKKIKSFFEKWEAERYDSVEQCNDELMDNIVNKINEIVDYVNELESKK